MLDRTWRKLSILYASADRFGLFHFAANRSQRVVGRQGRNVGACGCRTRSTCRHLLSLPTRSPRNAGRHTRISEIARAVQRRCCRGTAPCHPLRYARRIGATGPSRRTLDKLGIPRTTFYRWYDRYLSGGPEALKDRSPRPSRVWNRIPEPVCEKIKDLALQERDLSPRELAVRFTDTENILCQRLRFIASSRPTT